RTGPEPPGGSGRASGPPDPPAPAPGRQWAPRSTSEPSARAPGHAGQRPPARGSAARPALRKRPAVLQGAPKGHRIGIENAAAARDAESDARDAHLAARRNVLDQVVAGRLALHVVRQRQHDLVDLPGFDPREEARDVEVV